MSAQPQKILIADDNRVNHEAVFVDETRFCEGFDESGAAGNGNAATGLLFERSDSLKWVFMDDR